MRTCPCVLTCTSYLGSPLVMSSISSILLALRIQLPLHPFFGYSIHLYHPSQISCASISLSEPCRHDQNLFCTSPACPPPALSGGSRRTATTCLRLTTTPAPSHHAQPPIAPLPRFNPPSKWPRRRTTCRSSLDPTRWHSPPRALPRRLSLLQPLVPPQHPFRARSSETFPPLFLRLP